MHGAITPWWPLHYITRLKVTLFFVFSKKTNVELKRWGIHFASGGSNYNMYVFKQYC